MAPKIAIVFVSGHCHLLFVSGCHCLREDIKSAGYHMLKVNGLGGVCVAHIPPAVS